MNRVTTIALLGLLTLGAAHLYACDGETLDVGGPSLDAAVDSDAGVRWVGYLANYQLASGSSRIAVSFSSSTSGTVIFGEGPLLDPPTNPDVGYPADLEGALATGVHGPMEHFAFPILEGISDGEHITFSISQREVWRAWCQLQPPQAVFNYAPDGGDGGLVGFNCLPNVSTEGAGDACYLVEDGDKTPVDCGKLFLCDVFLGGVCACEPNQCDVETVPDIHFDLHRVGDALDGYMDATAMHLERAP